MKRRAAALRVGAAQARDAIRQPEACLGVDNAET
jgi:hypothetical protein